MGRKGRREEDKKAEGARKWSLRRGGEKKHLGHTKQLGENSIPQGGKAWREWQEGGRTGRGKGKEE